ncbi:MAG: hypothetical protein R3C03_20315 [Pirellulaceae bacterium]
MSPSSHLVKLDSLTDLFFSSQEDLGTFTSVSRQEMPATYRELLAHNMHMTVTVESFHHSLVDVVVLRSRRDENFYSREILLVSRSDGRVVQYGIVRLNFDFLNPVVVSQIESEETPLGRILINHGVLREVRLENLYRIEASEYLARQLQLADDAVCFGRTAMIYCDAAPAIELLEVVP